MKKWMFWVVMAAVPARAAWYGTVGKSVEKDVHSLEFVYDTGSRQLEDDETNARLKLRSHRFGAQYAQGIGQGFEAVVRARPLASRINFAGSALNPNVWGLGAGVRWAPPQPLGPVRVGLLATLDYDNGRESGDKKFDWLETDLAAGATYDFPHHLSATGGLSFRKAEVHFWQPGRDKRSFGLEKEVGGFLGGGWAPSEAWDVSTEIHFGNETVWGLAARYNFQ